MIYRAHFSLLYDYAGTPPSPPSPSAVGIAVAAVWAVSTFRVPVTMWAEDEKFFLGFDQAVGADHSVGFTYGDDGSMFFRYKYRF